MNSNVSMKVLLEKMERLRDDDKEGVLVIDLEDTDDLVDLEAGDDVSIDVISETDPLDDDEKKTRKKKREKRAHQKERHKAIMGDPYGYEDHLKPLGRGILKQKEGKQRKKKKKINAIPGNPYHGLDGRLTDPGEEAGSWSIAVDGPHKADRQSGQARRPSASKKQVFTKRRCGRGPGGKGKAKYKCKSGEKAYQQEALLDEDNMNIDSAYLRGLIRSELVAVMKQFQKSTGGTCSFQDLVRAQNIWSQSEKGDVGKIDK